MQDQIPPSVPDNLQGYLPLIIVIWTSVVGGIGYLVKYWVESRKKKLIEAPETDVDLRFTLEELIEIHDQARELIKRTSLDRFLILRAENGKDKPMYATAIYEQHRDVPVIVATTAYRRVRLDDEYRKMLSQAENGDVWKMTTATMPEWARLRAIYEAEAVTHSNCYFICRLPLRKDQDKWILFYITMATHQETGFTQHEETAFQLFADWLKDLFAKELGG